MTVEEGKSFHMGFPQWNDVRYFRSIHTRVNLNSSKDAVLPPSLNNSVSKYTTTQIKDSHGDTDFHLGKKAAQFYKSNLFIVEDKDIVDSALATATEGNLYLVNGVGLNDWAGFDYDIVKYWGGEWVQLEHEEGLLIWTKDENEWYQCTAADTWSKLSTSISLSSYLLIADIDDTPVNAETSAPISSNWAYDHVNDPSAHYDHSSLLSISDIDDTPVNGVTNAPISSNWAYDHENDASAHHSKYTNAEAVDAIEAAATAVMAGADSLLFIDATDGVLKQELITDWIDDTAVNGETGAPISSNWAYDHENDASAHYDHSLLLLISNIDDTPVNGVTNAPISSNWAYDHENDASAHHSKYTSSDLETDLGLSVAALQDNILYGSGNAAYVPCMYGTNNSASKLDYGLNYEFSNLDATTHDMYFLLPLPPVRGSTYLNTTGIKIELSDADSSDFITAWYVYRVDYNSADLIASSTTNITTVQSYTSAWSAHNMIGYDQVWVRITVDLGTTAQFAIRSVLLNCYYA